MNKPKPFTALHGQSSPCSFDEKPKMDRVIFRLQFPARCRRFARLLTLLGVATTSGDLVAQSPPFVTGPVENPGLKRFNRSITFYLGFEGTLQADLATGSPDPRSVKGAPEFVPGIFGKALGLKATDFMYLDYATLDNLDVRKPGALAMWTAARNWVRGDEEGYFWPAKIMSNGVQLMFGRQGQLLNPTRRTDMLYLWTQIGSTKDFSISHGDSLKWNNGEWHLWVMNWRANSVEFSMDGGPPQRHDTPAPFHPAGDTAGSLILGQQGPATAYLVDEVIVFDRPLSEDEIKWMHEKGMKTKE